MSTAWIVRRHHHFYKDIGKLGRRELENFYSKASKIRENPIRMKHLSGGGNLYREPITDNVRLIYSVRGTTIWLLTIGTHKKLFNLLHKRLHSLRTK